MRLQSHLFTKKKCKLKKLKVLVIGSSTPHVRNHVNRIKDEFDIEIITTNSEFIPENTPYHIVDFSIRKLTNLFKSPRKIKSIIDRFSPDVIHVHQANSFAFYSILANRGKKLPLILTLWGSDILVHPKEGLLNKIMTQYVLKRSDIITSDAQFLADEAQKLVPATKLDVRIANFGVEKIEIPIHKEKIIYSNRNHSPLYRIDEVIKAFHRFIESGHKDWKLIIAGRGSETENLQSLVNQLELSEHVEFAGFVNLEQNASNYARATYFVSIPESDATAMSLLEAMYFKCVPVVNDLPANLEWIENGKNGLVVDDLSADFLSKALAIDVTEAGEINRSIILEKGTIEVSKKIFSDIIYQAMEKKKEA